MILPVPLDLPPAGKLTAGKLLLGLRLRGRASSPAVQAMAKV